ncbi:MAG: hypothetical protein IKX92_00425, partial [Clostridia bacterium]|nr:hypothetical protein [Clostridia bacterium]
DGATMKRQTDSHSFASDPLYARYIKYVQNKRNYIAEWNAYYSGGISEVRVYSFNHRAYNKLIEEAYDAVAYYGKGTPEASALQKNAAKLEAYLKKDVLYARNIETLADAIRELLPRQEESAPESAAPAESSAAQEEGNPARHTVLVIIAAVLAAVAAVLLVIRARNIKNGKKQ